MNQQFPACVRACVHVCIGLGDGEYTVETRTALDRLELELQVVASPLTWVLEDTLALCSNSALTMTSSPVPSRVFRVTVVHNPTCK